MKLFLASKNRGKQEELRALLAGLPVEVCAWEGRLPPETGATLTENARIKARAVAETGVATVGDDTGLEVDALGGAPGVHSARYAGPACDPAANIEKLLGELRGRPPEQRRARFRTILCLCAPDRAEVICEGTLEGVISESPRGEGGFGYDPIFHLPECDRTLAELSFQEKNRLSHRGRAGQRLREALMSWLRP